MIAPSVLEPASPSIGPGLKPLQLRNVWMSFKLFRGATALSAQFKVVLVGTLCANAGSFCKLIRKVVAKNAIIKNVVFFKPCFIISF